MADEIRASGARTSPGVRTVDKAAGIDQLGVVLPLFSLGRSGSAATARSEGPEPHGDHGDGPRQSALSR